MMNWKYPVTLAVFLGLLLSACKKESRPAPVFDPLTVAVARPNDTLIIKGKNFNTAANANDVRIDYQEATVISLNETEIKILLPATPGSYRITVTTNGNTFSIGSVLVSPLTFYMIKAVQTDDYSCQLIKINPQDGKETLILNLVSKINDIVYYPATNEIIGVNNSGSLLMQINATNGDYDNANLSYSATSAIRQLVVDKNNNLYGIKYDWTTPNHQLQSLIKIDRKTKISTVIKTFESNDKWYEPVYIPATNDIVGLMNNGTRLFKLNLTTKDTSGVYLPGSTEAEYRELIVDDKSNLYAYKGNYPGNGSDVAKFVKVNAANGQEVVLKDLPVNGKFHDNIIFVPELNEFIGAWEQNTLYRMNANSFNINPITLTTGNSYTYSYFTTN